MTDKLDKDLVSRFPKLFKQYDAPMTETCMCWGFECGDGWFNLINDLCIRMQDYLDKHPEVEQVEATQVKEKFGGLRFYYMGGDDVTSEMIAKAEQDSYTICEKCGSTVGVHQTKGWIQTLCSKCDTKTS